MSYNGLGYLKEEPSVNSVAFLPKVNTPSTTYVDPNNSLGAGNSRPVNLNSDTSNQGGGIDFSSLGGSIMSGVGSLFGGSGSGAGGNSSGLGSLLNSDAFKGFGTAVGIGTDIWGMFNQKKALKQAERQWEAENARANKIMAMNEEKYNTFKADKARLNSQYASA